LRKVEGISLTFIAPTFKVSLTKYGTFNGLFTQTQ